MASSSSTSSATHYDAIILGSGQCGTPLAKAFADAGKKTAIIDRAHIGGTCINEGCTPTKTMIASGRVAYLARRGGDYGVHFKGAGDSSSGPAAITVDMAKVRQRKRDIVTSFSGGSEARLQKAGVEYLRGEAAFTGPRALEVTMNEGGAKRAVTADLLFVNVGESPSRPKIAGLDSVDPARVLNSTSIMELGEVPSHLIVLGGGYIGLEFGQLFRRLGAEVTVIQHAKQLAPREDEDIADCLLGILKEDGIKIHLSTRADAIEKTADSSQPIGVKVSAEAGQSSIISGSHLLLATGRVPNTANLNLDKAGIKTTPRGHIVVDETLATSAEGVYAIGDVHGGPAFTHISYDDYRILKQNLLPGSLPPTTPKMTTTAVSKSRNLVPYVMYTDPQMGHIGLHDGELADLAKKGRKIKTAKMPMNYVARALETDESRGMMKASVDAETGEILGFTCLGLEGGEIMAVVQACMMGNVKWFDLEAAVWAHPSLAESLNNLWGFLEDKA